MAQLCLGHIDRAPRQVIIDVNQMGYSHRDRCACLERERASSSVAAATFVKMSGDACNHKHEWQLLGLNMGLNGNF